jgi:signal transduction histidine kinase
MEMYENSSTRRALPPFGLASMTTSDEPAAGLAEMSQLATVLARELTTPVRSLEEEVSFLERGSNTLCRFIDLALEADPEAPARPRLDSLRLMIPSAIQALRDDCERLEGLLAELQMLSEAIAEPPQR